jgi:hypothetical protein
MDTTQNLVITTTRESDKNALVLRLEQTERDLTQLRTKLNSYRCEPRTYSLFERIETLKRGMDSLSKTNREIISAIRQHKKTVDDFVDHSKKQFLEFKLLHVGVEEYLRNCLERHDTS